MNIQLTDTFNSLENHKQILQQGIKVDLFRMFVSNCDNVLMFLNTLTGRLTDDVCVDLHLSVLLRQLERFIVALRQHQEVDGWAVVVQQQEEPETRLKRNNLMDSKGNCCVSATEKPVTTSHNQWAPWVRNRHWAQCKTITILNISEIYKTWSG